MYPTPDHHKRGKKPRNYRDRKLIFIDLEMTGFDPDRHEIIEVAWLVVEPRIFKVLSEYEAKIKPEHLDTADSEGLRVAGYSEKKWENAKNLVDVLKKLTKVAPNAYLAGSVIHNDWQFLERAFEKYQIKPNFNSRVISVDSIAYARLYKIEKVEAVGMRSVAKYLKIKYSEEHGALADARLSYEVFKKLMELNN